MKVLCLALFFAAVAFGDQKEQFINDNNVLNYALTLENFESALYKQGLAFFGTTDTNYTAAGYPVGTAAVLSAISVQEANHAVALTGALGQRGWPAVSTCTYQFNFTTVDAFFATLSLVELTGTEAYDGAARALTNKDLLSTAARIATVEARHTAAIQYIRRMNPFFGGTSEVVPGEARHVARNQDFVFNRVKDFFLSCNNVTQSVGYMNNSLYRVNSAEPSTYTWKPAAVLRGAAATNVGLDDAEYNSAFQLYWGSRASPNNTNLLNDAKVLNYALTLENLENAFYKQFNLSYTAAEITKATGLSAAAAGLVSQYIGLIATHESSHVNFLGTTISSVRTAFGVEDATFKISPACETYNWTALAILTNSGPLNTDVPNFINFLAAATALETTGVQAYAGAITSLTNSYITTIAASIATVEAEHTSYLIQLNQSAANLAANTSTTASFPQEIDDYQNITVVIGKIAGAGKVIGVTCATNIGATNLPSSDDRTDFYGDANVGQPSLNNGTVTTGGTNNGGSTTNNGASSNNGGTGNSASTIVISAAVIAAAAVFVL